LKGEGSGANLIASLLLSSAELSNCNFMFIISRLAELGILSVVVFTIELSSTDGVVLAASCFDCHLD
jgi:hypothetical protein